MRLLKKKVPVSEQFCPVLGLIEVPEHYTESSKQPCERGTQHHFTDRSREAQEEMFSLHGHQRQRRRSRTTQPRDHCTGTLPVCFQTPQSRQMHRHAHMEDGRSVSCWG